MGTYYTCDVHSSESIFPIFSGSSKIQPMFCWTSSLGLLPVSFFRIFYSLVILLGLLLLIIIVLNLYTYSKLQFFSSYLIFLIDRYIWKKKNFQKRYAQGLSFVTILFDVFFFKLCLDILQTLYLEFPMLTIRVRTSSLQ